METTRGEVVRLLSEWEAWVISEVHKQKAFKGERIAYQRLLKALWKHIPEEPIA